MPLKIYIYITVKRYFLNNWLVVPLLSLLLLMCLLTPDPVKSPYWPYTAPTVHVLIASCESKAFISEDEHNQHSKRRIQ